MSWFSQLSGLIGQCCRRIMQGALALSVTVIFEDSQEIDLHSFLQRTRAAESRLRSKLATQHDFNESSP